MEVEAFVSHSLACMQKIVSEDCKATHVTRHAITRY